MNLYRFILIALEEEKKNEKESMVSSECMSHVNVVAKNSDDVIVAHEYESIVVA